MYPTLFQIGSFRIDSYSVIWFIALALAILWSIKRLEIYNLDEYEARKIMAISFLCMLFGARAYEYISHWKLYLEKPSLFLDLNRGGLHEFGAVLGAFISAFVMCMFSKKISFLKLCDAAIIPAMLAIAIGRWGCFLNGCCVGRVSNFFTAVHFPRDRAEIFRHPVQIYYSICAILIVIFLLWLEKKILAKQKQSQKYYSIIAPTGIILYILMRFLITITRDTRPFSWLVFHTWVYKYMALSLPLICVWLAYSLRKLKTKS